MSLWISYRYGFQTLTMQTLGIVHTELLKCFDFDYDRGYSRSVPGRFAVIQKALLARRSCC